MQRKAARDQSVRTVINLIALKATPGSRVDHQDEIERSGPSTLVVVSGGVQQRLPETDPNRISGAKVFASDPALVVPVIASQDEISRAREIRQQLRKKYLGGPSEPSTLWCVGIDYTRLAGVPGRSGEKPRTTHARDLSGTCPAPRPCAAWVRRLSTPPSYKAQNARSRYFVLRTTSSSPGASRPGVSAWTWPDRRNLFQRPGRFLLITSSCFCFGRARVLSR